MAARYPTQPAPPKVAALKVVEAPEPDEDMIAMLETFLDRARKGEMNFLACACTFKDQGTVAEGYVKRSSAHRYTVIGVLETLKHKFVELNVED